MFTNDDEDLGRRRKRERGKSEKTKIGLIGDIPTRRIVDRGRREKRRTGRK